MVQFWMQKNAPDEVAMLIAEDTPEMKSTLQNVHEGYTNSDYAEGDGFHAPNVIDAVHFAKKEDSILLQIADHCAFITKRQLMGKDDVRELYSVIRPHISYDYKPVRGFYYSVRVDQIELVSDPARIARLRGD